VRRREPQTPLNPFGSKKEYNQIWEARKTQQVTGFDDERRKRYVDAIRGELDNSAAFFSDGKRVLACGLKAAS